MRVVAFFLVIVVVLGVAVLAVGWYATRTYFVAFDAEQVVIYRGRPGGLLWIEPTVKEESAPSLDRAALVGRPLRPGRGRAVRHQPRRRPGDRRAAAAPTRPERCAGGAERALRRLQLMGRIRRTTELGLLLLGGLIIAGTYTLASLGRTASLPADIVGFLGVVLGLLLAAHLAVRRLAPEADGLLLPLAGLLNGLGYVFIARTSERLAGLQAAWTAIGLGAFVVTLLVVRRVRDLERYRYTFAFAGIGLLLLPLVPAIGQEINGARIWVSLGPLNFQPGEPAKLLLALFLASYLVERRELLAVASLRVGPLSLPDPKHLGPLLAAWGISILVMVSQKDLGSSLLFFTLFVVMVWVATERASYLVMGVVMFAAGAAVAYQLFAHVRERMAIWFDPWPVAGRRVPGGGGGVRPGCGRHHRRRAGARRPHAHPGTGDRLHLRGRRRGARPAGRGRHPGGVHAARRGRPAHSATDREPLREAPGPRPGDAHRRAGIPHHRRRHTGAAPHRRDAAVRVLRRLLAGGQLRDPGVAHADLRRDRGAGARAVERAQEQPALCRAPTASPLAGIG